MENNTLPTQNLTPEPAPSPAPSTPSSPFIPIFITLIASGVLFGSSGFAVGRYMAKQTDTELVANEQRPTPSPTSDHQGTNKPAAKIAINDPARVEATRKTSPDGKLEVWVDSSPEFGSVIMVHALDGSGARVVAHGTAPSQTIGIGGYEVISPVWSPDSTKIAYVRAVITELSGIDVTERLDIYIATADGSSDTLLAENVTSARGKMESTDLSWNESGVSYIDYADSFEGKKVVLQP